MELIDVTRQTVESSVVSPSPTTPYLSIYSNPMTLFLTNLITTRTVKDVYSLLSYFPKEAALDSYIKMVINNLELNGIIKIDRGEFVVLNCNEIYRLTSNEKTSPFPQIMEALTTKVTRDLKNTSYLKNKEHFLCFSFPNNPEVTARLSQISIQLQKDLLDLTEACKNKQNGGGVRMIGFVNAVPTGEDFSI